ncbi:hypothetical protein ES703_99934 [subsurface metagenome]
MVYVLLFFILGIFHNRDCKKVPSVFIEQPGMSFLLLRISHNDFLLNNKAEYIKKHLNNRLRSFDEDNPIKTHLLCSSDWYFCLYTGFISIMISRA